MGTRPNVGLLKRKPKLDTEQVCREFYESQLFGAAVWDSMVDFFANAFVYVADADRSLGTVDVSFLLHEMLALNCELFGLAWANHNYELSKTNRVSESVIFRDIVFTKKYLEQIGKREIWDAMGFYNKALWKAVVEKHLHFSWSGFKDGPITLNQYPFASERLVKAEEEATRWFEDFTAQVRESIPDAEAECVERQALRLLVLPVDTERLVKISQDLASSSTMRFGCQLNSQALFALQSIIAGLYESAVNYLSAVREFGSYSEMQERRQVVIKALKRWVSKQKGGDPER